MSISVSSDTTKESIDLGAVLEALDLIRIELKLLRITTANATEIFLREEDIQNED